MKLSALLSVAIHVLLGLAIFLLPEKSPHVKLKPRFVKILRIEPEAEKPKLSEKQSQPKSGSPSGGKPKKKLNYQDLLDLPAAPSEIGANAEGESTKQPYTGDKFGELLAEASDFSANFDLPLEFRRSISEGKAWAILLLKEDHIEIEYLGGTREIRAAMFVSLKQSSSQKVLREAFAYFKTPRLKISILYETHFAAPSDSEFKTERKVYDNELEITMQRFTEAPKFGVTGMVIEDEHSRRAQARDRMHWRQLVESPAYAAPVRNYKLK